MIQSKLIACLLCVPSALLGMGKQNLSKYLFQLKNNTFPFEKEEQETLSKSINMLEKDASIWQLMGMRCALRELLAKQKETYGSIGCKCGELKISCGEWINQADTAIKISLDALIAEKTKLLRKKITSCAQITVLTGAGFLLTYGIVLLIHDGNEKG